MHVQMRNIGDKVHLPELVIDQLQVPKRGLITPPQGVIRPVDGIIYTSWTQLNVKETI